MKNTNRNILFTQCPDVDDYTLYLSGKGTTEFNQAFDQHLKSCPLCSEAIEGYRLMNEMPETGNKSFHGFEFGKSKNSRWVFYLLGSAAAILILLAGWWSYQNSNAPALELLTDNQGIESGKNAMVLKRTKLDNQLPENYWYVCNENIYVNDQVVTPQFLNDVIDGIDPSKSLIIEVGCSCNNNVNQLIEQIKTRKPVTIITYSKDAKIKPNRS
jgi:hypothetical protein